MGIPVFHPGVPCALSQKTQMCQPTEVLHFYCFWIRYKHGLINYKDTKTKCHLKKLTSKGTLRQVLEFIDRRYSESCWHFLGGWVWTVELCWRPNSAGV
jgi:hypothetical protein